MTRKLLTSYILLALILITNACKQPETSDEPIDRKALVERHSVQLNSVDTLASLSVGNGSFAFTVDVTGLQTFPVEYENGVPLGTQSEWGWHSFPNTQNLKFEESFRAYDFHDRKVDYAVQWNEEGRQQDAANYYRQNPHRIQLGNVGFDIQLEDGSLASLEDIQNIQQELNMWTGEISSSFTVEGIPVDVKTYCHPEEDVISAKVKSPLLQEGRLKVRLRLPFPTGEWTDKGTNYTHPDQHQSTITDQSENQAIISHQIDTTNYFVAFSWENEATVNIKEDHYYLLEPAAQDSFQFSVGFNQEATTQIASFSESQSGSTEAWKSFWERGGAIDFSGSTDDRAFELERRIILSQYLTRVQCASQYPPQETGLTYNSWYGKPHMEMIWWHGVHFALWGRLDLLEKKMQWYETAAERAKHQAERQGYEGARWQKMTDRVGRETASSVGSFLIWQQPHYIYFAELIYRQKSTEETLNKYKDLIFETAEFMASYAYYNSEQQKYILGKGVIPAQERFDPVETYNPTYEVAYWHWALEKAQEWRERLGMERNEEWDEVLEDLSPLPVKDDLYLATESAQDSYTNPEFKTDHPSVFGTLGMLPKTEIVDTAIMQNTFDWIWENWSWHETWGWDFPMTAMTATRLGMPEKAVDAMLMDIQTNTYLPNGHNFQDGRLTLYLPGNGGVLTAAALMVAGYDGSGEMPGIPKNDDWQVKWEGLKKSF